MLDVNQTIVPDGLAHSDDGWGEQDELHTLVNGEPLPTWDGPMFERVVGPTNRLADAVDWFVEEGDDDLPRLPVATTDETDPGPLSISLESEPEPKPEPPPETVVASAPLKRRRVAVLSVLATAALGLAGLALVGTMGLTAVGAGAATVWLASGSDAGMPELEAVATAPVVEAEPAEGEAASEQDVDEPVAAPEVPTVPVAAPSQPASAPREPAAAPAVPEAAPEAPSEPEARRSRPPIVRPVGSGDADEEARTVKLITQPPAVRIVVDGVDHGRTPLKLDLPVGTHTVVLEQGDVRSTLSVAVEAGADPGRFCFAAAEEGVFAAAGCP